MLNQRSPLSFSPKNKTNEYQHCISSTSNTNFISILRFEGARFKKGRGQYLNEVQFQKKIGFLIFLAQGKNLTPMQVEIKK